MDRLWIKLRPSWKTCFVQMLYWFYPNIWKSLTWFFVDKISLMRHGRDGPISFCHHHKCQTGLSAFHVIWECVSYIGYGVFSSVVKKSIFLSTTYVQRLPFSWTTLRGKRCRCPIAVMRFVLYLAFWHCIFSRELSPFLVI